MKRTRLAFLVSCLAALTGQAPAPTGPAPTSGECPPLTGRYAQPAPLPDWAASLGAGGKVDVLGIGSLAMIGPSGQPGSGFTARAVRVLNGANAGASVTLVTRNARGALASDMLGVLKAELATHRYPLVLWQAGTIEATHQVPLDQFRATLAEGARIAAEAHASLILMDMQYSRLLQAHADPAPYAAVMAALADKPGVALLRRYDLTREWVTSGQIDLERAAPTERQVVADHLNDCLAQALAKLADARR